jgi:hypothetical protein
MSYFNDDTQGSLSQLDLEELLYRRWVTGFLDGLVSPDGRSAREAQLLSHVRSRPVPFAAFVSGVVGDLLSSLPAEDPWRHTIVVDGVVRSVRGDPFGTWADGTDLLIPSHLNVGCDNNLAALDPALSESAAWVIHLGGQGWGAACKALKSAVADGLSADDLFVDGCAAMRWVMHRRRAYTGADDLYVSIVMGAWARRAQAVVAGRPWDEARRARLAMQEKVPNGLYKWFTG